MNITYLGHSAVKIETCGEVILIDPYLVLNTTYNPYKDNIKHIFVTHAHSDHIGSSVEIAKRTGADVVGVFEIANYLRKYNINTLGVNFGGWVKFSFGFVMFLPATHTSSFDDGTYGGFSAGILFKIEDKLIYHAGDTSLNQEFKTLKEYGKIDLAFLPIGGFYTMGVDEAAIAANWCGADKVIPIHYNTFPLIKADTDKFSEGIKENGQVPIILSLNESVEI